MTETTPLLSVLGDTRQRSYLCRVSPRTLGKVVTSLPSVSSLHLATGPLAEPDIRFFAECYDTNTRQTTSLPSVTLGKVTSTHLLNLFFYSIQTNKRYITDITYIHHRYHHRHKYLTQTLIYKFSTQTVSTQVQKYQHKFKSINT